MEEDIETCGWFVFYKDQLLIEKKNGMYTIPFGTEPPMPVPVGSTIHTIGEIEGRTAKTFSVHAPVPGSFGGMCAPRGTGRNRTPYQKPEIFRQPAVALSQRNHDRLHRRL